MNFLFAIKLSSDFFTRFKYLQIMRKFVVLSIVLDRPGTILPVTRERSIKKSIKSVIFIIIPPLLRGGRGVYCFTSVRPSKIFFAAFFLVTVDGRNLIFGHKRHIGIPYCG